MSGRDRIFLAHASEDKARVRELYEKLSAHGYHPWLDEEDLIPGSNWREEIPNAIGNAAVCLACLSHNSIEKMGYVQNEFRNALSVYANLPPGSIFLIPVRLDDCKVPDLQIAKLRINLRDFQWVDLFADDGFAKLTAAIDRRLSNESSENSSNEETRPDLSDLKSDVKTGSSVNASTIDDIGDTKQNRPGKVWLSFAIPSIPVTAVLVIVLANFGLSIFPISNDRAVPPTSSSLNAPEPSPRPEPEPEPEPEPIQTDSLSDLKIYVRRELGVTEMDHLDGVIFCFYGLDLKEKKKAFLSSNRMEGELLHGSLDFSDALNKFFNDSCDALAFSSDQRHPSLDDGYILLEKQ